ncbi:uncharacterized protein METZ01_LOCUS296849, partial [marine metagenome]
MGGSIASQVENVLSGKTPGVECKKEMPDFVAAFYKLLTRKKILACHDRSDGGLITVLSEMAFASKTGLDIYIDSICSTDRNLIHALFNEELGIVIQIKKKDKKEVMRYFSISDLAKHVHTIGVLNSIKKIRIIKNDLIKSEWNLRDLLSEWNSVSYKMQVLRDNPKTAKEEFLSEIDTDKKGLHPKITFDIPKKLVRSFHRPKVAILREQGVNGHIEMAAAFDRVGFNCKDVHMTDLLSGKQSLQDYKGLVACGGFSYGDVLGAGEGWAANILHNKSLKKEFNNYFSREDVFTLGICNGCQMISQLSSLIPGAKGWPNFVKNISEKFEARVVQTKIQKTPSIFFKNMEGSILPVPVAHGEGRAELKKDGVEDLYQKKLIPLVYVDDDEK